MSLVSEFVTYFFVEVIIPSEKPIKGSQKIKILFLFLKIWPKTYQLLTWQRPKGFLIVI